MHAQQIFCSVIKIKLRINGGAENWKKPLIYSNQFLRSVVQKPFQGYLAEKAIRAY